AAIQLVFAFILAAFLASGYAWDIIARAAVNLLEATGIQAAYVSRLFLMYVRLLDGSVVGFQVLLECSGLITLLIFTFISSLTIGLLRGSLKIKIVWFLLSISVGFMWNLFRLASVIAVAYNFGIPAFWFVHYILAPTIEFVWIVSAWALGMSWLKRRRSL
ncbi:TPA: exosortase/archaeosortase family protein, partial [Candidatus Bathyarchaeota archaeon]|nr:exosortase/archaeosortase family protein [Candidatus Bathyarchaeota archaeon]